MMIPVHKYCLRWLKHSPQWRDNKIAGDAEAVKCKEAALHAGLEPAATLLQKVGQDSAWPKDEIEPTQKLSN